MAGWIAYELFDNPKIHQEIKRARYDGHRRPLRTSSEEGSHPDWNGNAKALEKNLSGIKNMPGLPGRLFVIDSKNEEIAVAEARGSAFL
jgi:ribosomal protein S2